MEGLLRLTLRAVLVLPLLLQCSAAFAAMHGGGYVPTLGAPTISAISPSNGGIAGKNKVTVTGTNFSGVTGIKFGSTPGTNVSCSSSTTCTVVTPAGSGLQTVSLTTGAGTATYSSFSYQTITSLGIGGGSDPNGTTLWGTENRTTFAHWVLNGGKLNLTGASQWATCSNPLGCWTVFIAKGDWVDSACSGNAILQVDMLPSSLGSIYNDFSKNGSGCTGFQVSEAAGEGVFDYNGSAVALPATQHVAINTGIGDGTIYFRDDYTGTWINPQVNGAAGCAGPGRTNCAAVRSLAWYDDTSNGQTISYLILGADGTGTRNGLPHNMTFQGWEQGGCGDTTACWTDGTDENFVVFNGGSTCTVGNEGEAACTNLPAQFGNGFTYQNLNLRFQSVVKCPTSNYGVTPIVYGLFASVGIQVWRRNNNDASSTWSLFQQVTNATDQSNTDIGDSNGIRGLACVPTTDLVDHPSGYVLQGTLQISGVLYQFDTQTSCLGISPHTCTNSSTANLSTAMYNQWGASAFTSSGAKAKIDGYNGNETFVYTAPVTGTLYSVLGLGNTTATSNTRPSITMGNNASPGAVAGFWWVPVALPSSPTLYPSSAGTTASPPLFLSALSPEFASAQCNNSIINGGKCYGEISTRTIICSPFPEDGATAANGQCGQVLFGGGVDMQGGNAVVTGTAWLLRIPVDSSILPSPGD